MNSDLKEFLLIVFIIIPLFPFLLVYALWKYGYPFPDGVR
jgi:hypothetical protein